MAKRAKKVSPNFNQIFSSAWQKTTAPFKGARLPNNLNPKEWGKELTLGLAALLFLMAALSIATLFFGANLIQGWRERTAAAIVNGEVVSRGAAERRLIQIYGEQITSRLIDETLILQEGSRLNIEVTDEDFQRNIDEIEAIYAPSKISEILEVNKLSLEDLHRDIRIKVITDKILGVDVSINEEDINKFFEENKDSLAAEANKKPEELKVEDVREVIVRELIGRQISAKQGPWLEELRSKAKIEKYLSP